MSDLEKEDLKKKNKDRDDQEKQRRFSEDTSRMWLMLHGLPAFERLDQQDPDFPNPTIAAPGVSTSGVKLLPDGDFKVWAKDKNGNMVEMGRIRKEGDMLYSMPPIDLDNPEQARKSFNMLLKAIGHDGKTAEVNFGSSEKPINWELFKLENPDLYEKRVKQAKLLMEELVKSGRPFNYGSNFQGLIDTIAKSHPADYKQFIDERDKSHARSMKVDNVAKNETLKKLKEDIDKHHRLPDAGDALKDKIDKHGKPIPLTRDEELKVMEEQFKKVEAQLIDLEKAEREAKANVDAYKEVLTHKDGPLEEYGLGIKDVRDHVTNSEANRKDLLQAIEDKQNDLLAAMAQYDVKLPPAAPAGGPKPPASPAQDLKDKQEALKDRCKKCEAGVDRIRKDAANLDDELDQAEKNFPQQRVRP